MKFNLRESEYEADTVHNGADAFHHFLSCLDQWGPDPAAGHTLPISLAGATEIPGV